MMSAPGVERDGVVAVAVVDDPPLGHVMPRDERRRRHLPGFGGRDGSYTHPRGGVASATTLVP